ncbi:hypothetical protein BH23PLA1_BH23PLA1_19610 [soil metagenome]
MPGKAAKITITERQQEILWTLKNAVTAPARLRQRASIILLAFEGHRNEEIAQEVGLAQGPVGIWRRRWAGAFERLDSHRVLRDPRQAPPCHRGGPQR